MTMPTRATPHYPLLRNYVREVARELVSRGTIKRRSGQSIDEIIRQEARVVFADVACDLRVLALELGIGLALGGASLLDSVLREENSPAATGMRTLLDLFTNPKR